MKNRIGAFVLGSMPFSERARMAEARRHDAALDRAVEKAEDLMAPLALAIEDGEPAPPPELWDRIDAAVDADNEVMAGRILLGASEGNWQQMAPGIEAKMLWNDKTFLLRCAPGAQMAEHIHADKEHLLVLSGDLIIGNRTFLPGDYIGSPAGSDLFLHTTRTGCMLLSQIGA